MNGFTGSDPESIARAQGFGFKPTPPSLGACAGNKHARSEYGAPRQIFGGVGQAVFLEFAQNVYGVTRAAVRGALCSRQTYRRMAIRALAYPGWVMAFGSIAFRNSSAVK